MKKKISILMASSMLVSSVISVNPIAYADEKLDYNRLSGLDRYETCARICKDKYDRSEVVILASGESFPDALSSGALSIKEKSPLLLVKKDSIPKVIQSELKRLKVKKIIVVGGENSISKEVEEQLSKDYSVERIAGKDRYETSQKVAEKTNFKNNIIVSGKNYADALVATSLAAKLNMNIILSDGDDINKRYDKEGNIILGGTASINIPGIKGTRIAGKNRYETSLKVAEKYFKDAKNTILTSGDTYADSLSASSIISKKVQPIILIQKVNPAVAEYVRKYKLEVTVVGGNKSVAEETVKKILPEKTTSSSGGGSSSSGGGSSKPRPKPEPKPEPKYELQDGEFYGRGDGFKGTENTEIKVVVENHKIKDIILNEFNDDIGYDKQAWTLIDKFKAKIIENSSAKDILDKVMIAVKTPNGTSEPDVRTGATYTARGVFQGLEKALEKSRNHVNSDIATISLATQPKSRGITFGDKLDFSEFSILIKYKPETNKRDKIVPFSELATNNISVNIPNGTKVTSTGNLGINEKGRFRVIFTENTSKATTEFEYKAQKRMNYKFPSTIEFVLPNGEKKVVDVDQKEFLYTVDVDVEDPEITSIVINDENNIPIEGITHYRYDDTKGHYYSLEIPKTSKVETAEEIIKYKQNIYEIHFNYQAPTPEPEPEKSEYANGKFVGHGYGHHPKGSNSGDTLKDGIKVDVEFQDNKIVSIALHPDDDTYHYGDDVRRFQEKAIKIIPLMMNLKDNPEQIKDLLVKVEAETSDPFNPREPVIPAGNELDTISGATRSARGITRAVVDAIEKAKSSVEEVIKTEIRITSPSTENKYFIGDKLDLNNLVAHVKYSDDKEEDISYADFSKKGLKVEVLKGKAPIEITNDEVVLDEGNTSYKVIVTDTKLDTVTNTFAVVPQYRMLDKANLEYRIGTEDEFKPVTDQNRELFIHIKDSDFGKVLEFRSTKFKDRSKEEADDDVFYYEPQELVDNEYKRYVTFDARGKEAKEDTNFILPRRYSSGTIKVRLYVDESQKTDKKTSLRATTSNRDELIALIEANRNSENEEIKAAVEKAQQLLDSEVSEEKVQELRKKAEQARASFEAMETEYQEIMVRLKEISKMEDDEKTEEIKAERKKLISRMSQIGYEKENLRNLAEQAEYEAEHTKVKLLSEEEIGSAIEEIKTVIGSETLEPDTDTSDRVEKYKKILEEKQGELKKMLIALEEGSKEKELLKAKDIKIESLLNKDNAFAEEYDVMSLNIVEAMKKSKTENKIIFVDGTYEGSAPGWSMLDEDGEGDQENEFTVEVSNGRITNIVLKAFHDMGMNHEERLNANIEKIKEKILGKKSNEEVLEYLKEQKELTDTRFKEDQEYVDDEKKTPTPDVITGSTYSTKSLLDTLVKLMEDGITKQNIQ